VENRHHSRVSVDPQCRVQFQLRGEPYRNIPVSDLGADGCRVQIPIQSIGGLSDESPLERFELLHPALPSAPIKAKVVWVHAEGHPKTGFIASGVQFMDAPAGYTRKLAEFVTALEPPSTYQPE
jgi:PilZ domain